MRSTESATITRPSVRPSRAPSRVVAIGGGRGLPVVLAGLRRWLPTDCHITAVVTAADDGGSSGVLREQYDVLPPGDIRNCLLALSRVAPEVSAALQYRFDGAVGPGGVAPVRFDPASSVPLVGSP